MMKLKNILIGIAIGDAYGAGVEFQDRDWIRKHVDFTKFVNARASIKVADKERALFTENYNVWDYTDDTEMTIGVLKALLSSEEFTTELLIKKWREEYEKGKAEKGYGRNGHGSMGWYYRGEKSIEEIRSFQKMRKNPGNAPAMRAAPLGLIKPTLINDYARINAEATHPNINAIISGQCIAWGTEYMIRQKGDPQDIIKYCRLKVKMNEEYKSYLSEVDELTVYEQLDEEDYDKLCGIQPIQPPYFLSGIKGVPSDSKYTTGSVLYVLKSSKTAFDALQKSIKLGGDVDSIASITTGIMAGVNGLSSLPNFMLENVEGVDYLTKLADEFVKRMHKKGL